MHPVLNRNLFLVKEHVGFFKAASNYDVFDPETGEAILWCREPNLGAITKLFRFSDYKTATPFDIHVTTPGGDPILRVQRGISLFLSKVSVLDEEGDRGGGSRSFSPSAVHSPSSAPTTSRCAS